MGNLMDNTIFFWQNYYSKEYIKNKKAQKSYLEWLENNKQEAAKELSLMQRSVFYPDTPFEKNTLNTFVNIFISNPLLMEGINTNSFCWLLENQSQDFWLNEENKSIQLAQSINKLISQQTNKSLRLLLQMADVVPAEKSKDFQECCKKAISAYPEFTKEYLATHIYKLVPDWNYYIETNKKFRADDVCYDIHLAHYFRVNDKDKDIYFCGDIEKSIALSNEHNKIKSITAQEIEPLFKRCIEERKKQKKSSIESPPVEWAEIGRSDLAEKWVELGGTIDIKKEDRLLNSELWHSIICNKDSLELYNSIKHLLTPKDKTLEISEKDWKDIWNARMERYHGNLTRTDNSFELTPLLHVFQDVGIKPSQEWLKHSVRLGRLDWANQLIDMGCSVAYKDPRGNTLWHTLLNPDTRFTHAKNYSYTNYSLAHNVKDGHDYRGLPRLSSGSNKGVYRVFKGTHSTKFFKELFEKAGHLIETPNRKGILPLTMIHADIINQGADCGIPTSPKELYKIFAAIKEPEKTGKNQDGQIVSQAYHLSNVLPKDQFTTIERDWLKNKITAGASPKKDTRLFDAL